MWVVRCWNSCPERLWMPRPSLEVFKARLDGALGSLGWYEMWRLVALPVAGAVGASWSLGSFPTRAILWCCISGWGHHLMFVIAQLPVPNTLIAKGGKKVKGVSHSVPFLSPWVHYRTVSCWSRLCFIPKTSIHVICLKLCQYQLCDDMGHERVSLFSVCCLTTHSTPTEWKMLHFGFNNMLHTFFKALSLWGLETSCPESYGLMPWLFFINTITTEVLVVICTKKGCAEKLWLPHSWRFSGPWMGPGQPELVGTAQDWNCVSVKVSFHPTIPWFYDAMISDLSLDSPAAKITPAPAIFASGCCWWKMAVGNSSHLKS